MSIRLNIYVNRELSKTLRIDQPIIVGRRDTSQGDPAPISQFSREGKTRLIVADRDSVNIPRTWFSIEPTADDNWTIRNLHSSVSVHIAA